MRCVFMKYIVINVTSRNKPNNKSIGNCGIPGGKHFSFAYFTFEVKKINSFLSDN